MIKLIEASNYAKENARFEAYVFTSFKPLFSSYMSSGIGNWGACVEGGF